MHLITIEYIRTMIIIIIFVARLPLTTEWSGLVCECVCVSITVAVDFSSQIIYYTSNDNNIGVQYQFDSIILCFVVVSLLWVCVQRTHWLFCCLYRIVIVVDVGIRFEYLPLFLPWNVIFSMNRKQRESWQQQQRRKKNQNMILRLRLH